MRTNSQSCVAKLATVCLLSACISVVQASQSMDNITLALDEAIKIALSPNPGLAAVQAAASSAATLAEQQSALPDPRLAINLANVPLDSFSLSQEAMTQMQIGLSQDLPFPGKLGLHSDVASAFAISKNEEADEFRLQLIRQVKRGWWHLFYLDRAIETVENNKSLLTQLVTTAQTQYAVGKGLQQDVFLADLELAKLDNELLRLRAERQSQAVQLNAQLNRPTNTQINLPRVSVTTLPSVKNELQLQSLAINNRPKFRAQQARVDMALSQRDLARKAYFPDFRLAALYGYRDGYSDMATFQLSMSLPVYASKKQHRELDQRQAELLKDRYLLQDDRLRIAEELSKAIIRFRQAKQQLVLYQTKIIPQARQTVESMLASYQVGKVEFLGVVKSHTSLYNYESGYWLAYSNAQESLADIEAAVGQENIYE
ncbi:MAG: TolC family protein [Gammaproteobacteria bacterium]|nr:TolC family protein [Gammaproteobacteria bacterium]